MSEETPRFESSIFTLSPAAEQYVKNWEAAVAIYCDGRVVDLPNDRPYDSEQRENLKRALNAIVPVPTGSTIDPLVIELKGYSNRKENDLRERWKASDVWIDRAVLHLGEVQAIRDARAGLPSTRPPQDSSPDQTARFATVRLDIEK